MSAVSGVNPASTGVLDNIGAKETAMGKEDFLMLLVAQLENQDPMNPQDGSEFTAQLAQFSQLEQLSNVNENLQSLTTMSSEMERQSALSLIGTVVIAETEEFQFNGEPMELGYDLETEADEVKLYILGPTGENLATLSASDGTPGQHFFEWDGLGDTGALLDPGDYSLVVRAVDADDQVVPSESLLKGIVYGVDLDSDGSLLETSSGPVKMSKVGKAGLPL